MNWFNALVDGMRRDRPKGQTTDKMVTSEPAPFGATMKDGWMDG
jgi:hypothetical protein